MKKSNPHIFPIILVMIVLICMLVVTTLIVVKVVRKIDHQAMTCRSQILRADEGGCDRLALVCRRAWGEIAEIVTDCDGVTTFKEY